MDLCINIVRFQFHPTQPFPACPLTVLQCLTILGYFPGHIHAFYVEYIYFKRRDEARMGVYESRRAPGIYSERVQRGGERMPANPPPPAAGYGTMGPPPPQQY